MHTRTHALTSTMPAGAADRVTSSPTASSVAVAAEPAPDTDAEATESEVTLTQRSGDDQGEVCAVCVCVFMVCAACLKCCGDASYVMLGCSVWGCILCYVRLQCVGMQPMLCQAAVRGIEV